jgi:Protein of unknown function (DUF1706)
VYQSYAAQTAAEATRQSRQSATQLIDGLDAVSDDDLSDSTRYPWLRGRQLWLQVVVRGQALQTLAEAMSLNPDLRANAAPDPDLAPLRDMGSSTSC